MTAIALGCSHTAGLYLDESERYVSVLAQIIGHPIANLAEPGGNHSVVQQRLVRVLQKSKLPEFVVAQWPDPFRRMTWQGEQAHNETVKNSSVAFQQLLRQGEQNFYQPWLDTIVICNLLCRALDVKCINIFLQDLEFKHNAVLKANGVVLHANSNLPNETWLTDWSAKDNIHHSARCHRQWAERIAGLLNE